MVYKVRDEADIIEDNLRFHRAQGVDFFVVMDTGSTDGTIEILERYESAGLLRLERIRGRIQDVQGGGEESIARTAAEMGADWVIHNDADEFWWPASGTLKDALAEVDEKFGLVVAPRTEFVTRPGEGPFAERMTIREERLRHPPKSAHRASREVRLRGPHPVEIWSGGDPYRGLVGRPVLRTAATHREDDPLGLVIAPTFPIGVLHFPIRTFEQYRRRVEIARADGYLGRNTEARAVRDALAQNRLEEVFERLVLDDAAVAQAIREGWLVEQTSFRDYLAACPDPLGGGEAKLLETPSGGGGPTREDLRDDAMYALSRYFQTRAYRARQHREQAAEVRQARRDLEQRTRVFERRRRQLRRIQKSLWWRMRPRLPRALTRRRR
jgi:hypothetical protein